jgi:hypothetical protein
MKHHFISYFGMVDDPSCINCGVRRSEVERHDHYIFQTGYCDPRYCPRCQAEECSGAKEDA